MQSIRILRIAAFVVSAVILSTTNSCKDESTNPNLSNKIKKITWHSPYNGYFEYIAFSWSEDKVDAIVSKELDYDPIRTELSFDSEGRLVSALQGMTTYDLQYYDSGFVVNWHFLGYTETYFFRTNALGQIDQYNLAFGKRANLTYDGDNVTSIEWFMGEEKDYTINYMYSTDNNFMPLISQPVQGLLVVISYYGWGIPFHYFHSANLPTSYQAYSYRTQENESFHLNYHLGSNGLPVEVDLSNGEASAPLLKLDY